MLISSVGSQNFMQNAPTVFGKLYYTNTPLWVCQVFLMFNYSATVTAVNLFGLILTPGPIVEATATDLMY